MARGVAITRDWAEMELPVRAAPDTGSTNAPADASSRHSHSTVRLSLMVHLRSSAARHAPGDCLLRAARLAFHARVFLVSAFTN